jgi:hypothetical protein
VREGQDIEMEVEAEDPGVIVKLAWG